jgi:hypothetical protein
MTVTFLRTPGPRPLPRGIPVPFTPEQWAQRDAPHLETVRTLAAAGASLPVIAEAIGRNVKTVRDFLRRNNIQRAVKPDTRTVLILIEPVRWPTGPGRSQATFDREDTEEL